MANKMELTKIEDFENLNKGDRILVIWNEKIPVWNLRMVGEDEYIIYENRKRCNEIILEGKGNQYFNYKMCLNGDGVAKKVFALVSGDEQ